MEKEITEQLLFEDDKVKIIIFEDQLIRSWKDGRVDEFITFDELANDADPRLRKMVDFRNISLNEKDELINQSTGQELTDDEHLKLIEDSYAPIGG